MCARSRRLLHAFRRVGLRISVSGEVTHTPQTETVSVIRVQSVNVLAF